MSGMSKQVWKSTTPKKYNGPAFDKRKPVFRDTIAGVYNPRAKLPQDFQSHRFICLGLNRGLNDPPCSNLWREKNYCRFFGRENVLNMHLVSCSGFNKPCAYTMEDRGINPDIEQIPTKKPEAAPDCICTPKVKPFVMPDKRNRIVVAAIKPEPKISKVIELPTRVIPDPINRAPVQPIVSEPIVRVTQQGPYEFNLFSDTEQIEVKAPPQPKPKASMDSWLESFDKALKTIPSD